MLHQLGSYTDTVVRLIARYQLPMVHDHHCPTVIDSFATIPDFWVGSFSTFCVDRDETRPNGSDQKEERGPTVAGYGMSGRFHFMACCLLPHVASMHLPSLSVKSIFHNAVVFSHPRTHHAQIQIIASETRCFLIFGYSISL